MPRAWASATISFIGVTVPSTFDIWVIATILVRGVEQRLEGLEVERAVIVAPAPS